MSKKFDVISIILIILLIVVLIFVVSNYFGDESVNRVSTSLSSTIDIKGTDNIIIDSGNSLIITNNSASGEKETNSGDNIIKNTEHIVELDQPTQQVEDVQNESGEKTTQNSGDYEPQSPNIQEPNIDKTSTSLIVSSDEISSKEKKEVLKELDQTLMDLFEVVDSVGIVDESRLIIDENGGGE